MGNKFFDILYFLICNKFVNKKIFILDRIGPEQIEKYKFLINYLDKQKNIFFLTDSNYILKYHYKNNIKSSLFPILIQYKKKNNRKIIKKLNICYNLGPARIEKGFLEIPKIFKILKKEKDLDHYINYSNEGKKIELSSINKCKSIISKLNLNKEIGNLNYKKYIDYLHSINVIIFNYNENAYKKYRTSALFFEAITNNVIPIIKKNTWASQFYEKNKFLKNLIITNNNILKIIRYIKKNYYPLLKEIYKIKNKILVSNNNLTIYRILNLNKKEDKKNILLILDEKFIFDDLEENYKSLFIKESYSENSIKLYNDYSTNAELINLVLQSKIFLKNYKNINLIYSRCEASNILSSKSFSNLEFKLYKFNKKCVENKLFKKFLSLKINNNEIGLYKQIYILTKK